MAKFVESREMTNTKIKAAMKSEIMDYIEQCLIERYSVENVHYVRNGNGDSKTKELAVRMSDDIEAEGETYEGVVCVNASAKDYRERVGSKGRVYPAYQFNIMSELYDEYIEEKTMKANISKAKKKEKIEKDNARREEAKAKALEAGLIKPKV